MEEITGIEMTKIGIISSIDFDKKLANLLKSKAGKNVAKGRFDIESIDLKYKADFLVSFLTTYSKIFSITYKILFWEENLVMRNFFDSNFPTKSYKQENLYKNEKKPGVIFIDEHNIDQTFLKILLVNHFNYEMAEEPALNIRVQICLNMQDFIILLDIYDDRGFDIYYITTS